VWVVVVVDVKVESAVPQVDSSRHAIGCGLGWALELVPLLT
jgi:hypothetical protein